MLAAPGLEPLERTLVFPKCLEFLGGFVAVLPLRVPGEFVAARGAVGLDYCGEGARGGYEEGFQGEGEGAEGGEAFVGCEDGCSALGNGYVSICVTGD